MFMQILPQHLTEEPGQTFWPAQCTFYYNYIVNSLNARNICCFTLYNVMHCDTENLTVFITYECQRSVPSKVETFAVLSNPRKLPDSACSTSPHTQ